MAIGLVWTKVVALSTMFVLTLSFGLITLKLVKCFSRNGRSRKTTGGIIIHLLNCFAGGLFLGTFLLQLLPEVRELFEGILERYGVETTFPVAEAVTAVGFFIVMALEHILGMVHKGGHGHSHGTTKQSTPAEHRHETATDPIYETHGGHLRTADGHSHSCEPMVMNHTHKQNEQTEGEQLRNNLNNGSFINMAHVQESAKVRSRDDINNEPDFQNGAIHTVDGGIHRIPPSNVDGGYISMGYDAGNNSRILQSQGINNNTEKNRIDTRGGQTNGHGGQMNENGGQLNGNGGQINANCGQINENGGQLNGNGGRINRKGVQLNSHEGHSVVEKDGNAWQFEENVDNSQSPEVPVPVSSLRSIMLLVALSLHTLFEGLALGLQHEEAQIWALLIAVCVHKVVIVIALAIELAKVSDTKVKMMICSIFVFAIMSPIGIGIGTAISETGSPDDLATDTASGILQGLATGTFLYVTFFEVLQHELNDNHDLRKVLAVLLGFGSIIGLKFIGGDH